MRVLIVLFLLISLLANSQHTISSYVADAFSKEPLGYVNIGIKKKNRGTLTNVNGKFRITIPEVKMEDSLTFSTVGYESKTISIIDLITLKPDSIFLHQKTKELKEVAVIANGKWKTERIGLSKIFPGVFGVVQSDVTNDIVECAQQIDLGDELSKIMKFHIYLKEVKTDSANFRINFYAFDGESPTERIFENEIFIRKKVKNGWLEVDLENFKIWLNGKIVCSIEFLPSELQKDKITLYYGGILTNKGSSFSRTSSQGEWQKLDFGTYSIYLTTKKFVLKK